MDFPLNEIFANPQKLIEADELEAGVTKDQIMSDLLPSIDAQIDRMVASLYTQIMQNQPGKGSGLAHWLWRAGDKMQATGDRMRNWSTGESPQTGTEYESPRWWQAIKKKLGLEHASLGVYKDTHNAYLQLENELGNDNIGAALNQFADTMKRLFRRNLDAAITRAGKIPQAQEEKKEKKPPKPSRASFEGAEKDVYDSLIKMKLTPSEAEKWIVDAKEAGVEGDDILVYITKHRKPPRPAIQYPKPEPKPEPPEPKPEPKSKSKPTSTPKKKKPMTIKLRSAEDKAAAAKKKKKKTTKKKTTKKKEGPEIFEPSKFIPPPPEPGDIDTLISTPTDDDHFDDLDDLF